GCGAHGRQSGEEGLDQRLLARMLRLQRGEGPVQVRLNASDPRQQALLLVFDVQRQRLAEVAIDPLARVDHLWVRQVAALRDSLCDRGEPADALVAFEQQADEVLGFGGRAAADVDEHETVLAGSSGVAAWARCRNDAGCAPVTGSCPSAA